MNLKRHADTADYVPVIFYEDSRGILEQVLQGALGTVQMQIGVDVVDVLNCRSEIGPHQLVLRLSLLLVICFWFDTPGLQVAYQTFH